MRVEIHDEVAKHTGRFPTGTVERVFEKNVDVRLDGGGYVLRPKTQIEEIP